MSLSQLQLDFYPYHLAIGDRSTWIRYQPETTVHTGWLENSLKQFQTTLLDSIKDFSPSNGSKGSSHAPLSRAGLQASTYTHDKMSIILVLITNVMSDSVLYIYYKCTN